MSQKPTHNSKRRPPGESTESAQQDADWGFDSGEANPAVEKKLAVALVICLLAGFGFVFYQKFRLLRNSEGQLAGADVQAQQVEDAAGDNVPTEAGVAAVVQQSSTESINAESPFYEPSGADEAPPTSDETWTLTQAEIPQQSSPQTSSPVQPAELPPLPETTADTEFNPFGETDSAGGAAETPVAANTAPVESSTFVWEEPTAPAQTEPEPESLPAVPSQPVTAEPQSQADPFLLAADPDTPADSGPDTDTAFPTANDDAGTDAAGPQSEPQMLIVADEPSSSPVPADEEPLMIFESPPAQVEPQPAGADVADAQSALPAEASGFDPFAGDSTTAATSDTASDSGTGAAASETFDPFGSSEESAADAQPGPSMETTSEAEADQAPAGDPFAFPAPTSISAAQAAPAAANPALEPLPAAPPSKPPATPAAPVWPGDNVPTAPATTQMPAPLPVVESASGDSSAPQQMREPQQMTITPAEQQPASPFASEPHIPAATASSNPFAIDSGSSQPLIESSHDAQRVVGEREITVTPNDSFWSISEREYGSSRYFTALAKYNLDRVDKPEHLQSGMKIIIPPPEVLEDRFPELFRRTAQGSVTIAPMSGDSSSAEPPGLFLDELDRPMYRVGQRDTLSTIAEKHLGRSGRWTDIYELNRDRLTSPSTLTIGMELKLPRDANGVRVSPAGGFDR